MSNSGISFKSEASVIPREKKLILLLYSVGNYYYMLTHFTLQRNMIITVCIN